MTDITPILDKAVAGKRLTPDDGIALMKSSNLSAIGKAANAVTQRLHPSRTELTTLIGISTTPTSVRRSAIFVHFTVARKVMKGGC